MFPITALNRLWPFMLTALLSTSCATYMVSPLNTTSNPYCPMPVKQKDEPAKHETYAGFHISAGANTENQNVEDYFGSASLRIVQSHAFDNFRVSYGSHLILGSFNVDKGQNRGVNDEEGNYRHLHGGHLFYGAVGLTGAIAYAVPFSKGKGEWRVIGIQGSAFTEFGKYLDFRQNFPVSDSYYVNREKSTYTAGLFSEIVRMKKAKSFGFRLGVSFNTLQQMFYVYNSEKQFENSAPTIAHYLSFASFIRKGRVTGFVQGNIGTAVLNVQTGVLVQLNKPK